MPLDPTVAVLTSLPFNQASMRRINFNAEATKRRAGVKTDSEHCMLESCHLSTSGINQ